MASASTTNEKRQFGRPFVPGLLGRSPVDAGLGVRSRSRATIAKPMIATAAHTIAMTTINAAGLLGGRSRSAIGSPPGIWPRSAKAATVMSAITAITRCVDLSIPAMALNLILARSR